MSKKQIFYVSFETISCESICCEIYKVCEFIQMNII